MDAIFFNEKLNEFFNAVKKHTLLIIIDSKSKGSKAVFKLAYFDSEKKTYYSLHAMLIELGLEMVGGYRFITYCAGRYSYYILDNIGMALRNKGVELPEWWEQEIQKQNVI